MVRNQGKGGKNYKKSKNTDTIDKRQLEFKTEGQEYAFVTKMLGNSRCECKCSDGRTRLGHIRGNMCKRVWISTGDTVLVSLREFQDEKADIIHKYTHEEAKTLEKYNEISLENQIQGELDEEITIDDMCDIDFDDI